MRLARFHVEADDDNGKPALLLIHGLLSSRNHWLPNLDRLRRAFRTVRVDLPGHGLSPPAPDAAALHPDTLALALNRLRQDLGIGTWTVCGQSFGAGLSLRIALRFPADTAAHVFTNASVALSDATAGAVRARLAPRLARLRRDGDAALLAEPVHPRHARRYPPGLRDRLARDAAAMRADAYADLLEHGLANLALGPSLAGMQVSGLLVNGEWERRFQPHRLAAPALIPDLRIVDLPGGHSINIEQPEAFDRAVLRFSDSLGASLAAEN